MGLPELLALSAEELATGYGARRFNPVEVIEQLAQYVPTANPRINAFLSIKFDEARETATLSAERWAKGVPLGRLDGIPISIKDHLLVRGWISRSGATTSDATSAAAEDSPSAARLRESGAILFGHTTMPEYGWKPTGDSKLTGSTRNPWNLQKTSGGSSSGSAAAVAAGLGPLSVGTDGGGSVRIPASFCGVFGMKPSGGRVPHWPPTHNFALTHVGPIGRTVHDAAALLTVIAKPDSRDWTSLPYQETDYTQSLNELPDSLPIAFSPDLGIARVNSDVAEVVEHAVSCLRRNGLKIELCTPSFPNPTAAFFTLFHAGVASFTRDFDENTLKQLDSGLRQMVEIGRRQSGKDVASAHVERIRFGSLMRQFSERYPILLTPVIGSTAFDVGALVPPGFEDTDWDNWVLTHYFNATQQPAASVPIGLSKSGMPVGLQVIGPMFGDHLVLKFARRIELCLDRSFDRAPVITTTHLSDTQ